MEPLLHIEPREWPVIWRSALITKCATEEEAAEYLWLLEHYPTLAWAETR